jgi:hypothetical protein
MPPKIIAGEPGEAWVNTGPKVLFQCLVSWSNSCGSCVQYDHQIGPWWPLPRHRGCLCKNIPVPPGHEAEPFVDFQQEIAKLPPPQQARVIGVANWRLVESGTVPWGDVVTRTRIRPLKEVIARNELSVRDLTVAGVPRGRAASAWAAVHTPEREALAASRAEVVAKLRAGGLTADEIRREVAGRLAGRVGIGPSGGIGPVGPKPGPIVPPEPKPSMSGPKAVPVPAWKPTMTPAEAGRFAADSVLKEVATHVTTAEGAASLRAHGFDLARKGFGRVYGDGAYLGLGAEAPAHYEMFVRASGREPVTLKVRADVRNPLILGDPADHAPETILAPIPGGIDRYRAAVAAIEARNGPISEAYFGIAGDRPDWEEFAAARGYDFNPHGRALTAVVTGAGHDAIVIRQGKLTPGVGGSQVVVFDPKRVVIEEGP